jgi:competence protein ComEA
MAEELVDGADREVYSARAGVTPVGSFLRRAAPIAYSKLRDAALPSRARGRYAGCIVNPSFFSLRSEKVPNMKLLVKWIFIAAFACAAPAFAANQVDVNSADARMLAEALDGVGLAKAEAIVAYRDQHGPFETLEDLAKVGGIGPHILERNRDVIVFGKPRPPAGAHGSPHSLATW